MKYQSDTNSYTIASTNNTEEITASIQPLSQSKDISPINIKIFPGSAARICLADTEHFHN